MEQATHRLLEFHRSCCDEFHALAASFNLLFYGYGSKSALLAEFWPDAKMFNLQLEDHRTIIDSIVLDYGLSASCRTFEQIDEELLRQKAKLTLILLNFTFDIPALKGTRAIRLIATCEQTDFCFTEQDLVEYDFLLRDLTTFQNYTDEAADIEIRSSRVERAIQVLQSVPMNSRRVFKALLETGSCPEQVLFEKLKVPLLLGKISTLRGFLREFASHEILKMKENANIQIRLNSREIRCVIDHISKTYKDL